ncbi:MAG: hypothetical protein H6719_24000 [Sandaracinaceae bacterium]|nr:hypothetical protein [Sandaracinaceae bacterium]
MLVARCPQCGSPNPVYVATPHAYACRSCHYQGPPAPDVAQRLQAAGQILLSLDARGRQLGAQQRRVVQSARRTPWMLALLVVSGLVLLVPCVGAGALFGLTSHPSYSLAIICVAPPLVLGLVGMGIVLLAFRRRGALERACSATPPDVEGAPARCHVCGGPLPPESLRARGVVRCGYCQADNLVDPERLVAMGSQRVADIAGFEREVRRHGTSLKTESTLSILAIVMLVLGAPMICLLTSSVVYKLVPFIEVEPDLTLEYHLVDTTGGVCVSRVNTRLDSGLAFMIGPRNVPDVRSDNYVEGAARLPPLSADWLVGRDVIVHVDRRTVVEGRVVSVHGNPLEPEATLLELDPPAAMHPEVLGACLRDRPTGVTILPWPETSMRRGHSLPAGTRYDDPRLNP